MLGENSGSHSHSGRQQRMLFVLPKMRVIL